MGGSIDAGEKNVEEEGQEKRGETVGLRPMTAIGIQHEM